MLEIPFSLIALSRTVDATINVMEDKLYNVMLDFLSIFMSDFDENGEMIINSIQENTADLRHKVEEFIEKYKEDDVKVHRLRGYLQSLKENEKFYLRMSEPLSFDKNRPIYDYLTSLSENREYETVKDQMDSVFQQLLNVYHILSFGEHTKRQIGEPDKTKRICRFCKNKRANPTFKKVAHAVSEALGNKAIILNEECDECNYEFGKGIEQDMITFLKFDTSFHGIKGKEGVPKIKGKNYTITNTNGKVNLTYEGPKEEIKLVAPLPIVLQNVYKALCKYAVSVIPSEDLPYFDDTIKWMTTDEMVSTLPVVSILTSPKGFKAQPQFTVYIQKADHNELPYAVGELQLAYLTISFIVPFVARGGSNFHLPDNYVKYWEFFTHYKSLQWDFVDLSDSESRPFAVKIVLPKVNPTSGVNSPEK